MALDLIAEEACKAVNAPVALVTVLGREHQHFLGVAGLPEPWRSLRCTPLEMSFCRHVVLGNAPLQVDCAPRDPVFAAHPAVEALNIVAYLGVPLRSASGEALGALCAVDVALRRWSEVEKRRLSELARSVGERNLLTGAALVAGG